MLIHLARRSLVLATWLSFSIAGLAAQETPGLRAQRDFRVERVAGGEHLAGAESLAFDAKGQPWVLVQGERLIVLDTRVDGHRVFAHGLQGASAFVLSGSGVLLADSNGIQRLLAAEDGASPLISGLAASGLRISALVWGLDGYVYGALAGQGRWDYAERHALLAGIFRFAPDASKIEQVLALEGGVLSLELSWEGEIFFSAPATRAAHLLLPARALLDLASAPSTWQALAGITGSGAATALHSYGGGAWPADYAGSLILCDADSGELRLSGLLSSGNSFRALTTPGEPLLSSKDQNFNPLALAGGPGGGLYVLDARPETGTLWRVQHNSVSKQPALPLPSASSDQPEAWLAELAHPNLWRRLMAQRLLSEQGLDSDAERKLSFMARSSESPLIQLHTLWLGAGGAEYLAWCLGNYVASVRRNALAMVEDRFDGGRQRVPTGSVLGLVRDADARVRLQALLTWRATLGAGNISDLVKLVPSLQDAESSALVLAIAVRHPDELLRAVLRSSASEPYEPLIGAVAEHVARQGSGRELVELLLGLLAGEHMPRVQERVLIALHTNGREREKPWPSPRVSACLRRLGDSEELGVALAALPLAHAWAREQISASKLAGWLQRAVDVLEGDTQELGLRVAAARALLALPAGRAQGITFSGILLGRKLDAEQARQLLGELSQGSEETAGAVLVRSLGQLVGESRQVAQAGVLAKPEWVRLLLDALEAGSLSVDVLDARGQGELLQHADASLAARGSKLISAESPASE